MLVARATALIITCTLLPLAKADLADMMSQNLTTTSRVENYILQNQRQYLALIKTMAVALEEFKKSYDDRLSLLSLNREFLQFKIIEVEQNLVPLELLDDIHNFCVHKYRPKLPDISSVNISLATCTEKGRKEYPTIVNDPFFTLHKLENYYKNETVAALVHCRITYQEYHKNYTYCVTAVIQQSNEVSSYNVNMFYNQLKQAECSAILKMKDTFDCHAFVIFNTLKNLGEVTGLIESCTTGNELCSACKDDIYSSPDRCPYHMSMPLTDEFRLSEKVSNPFRGLTLGTPCLQINFINNKNITMAL